MEGFAPTTARFESGSCHLTRRAALASHPDETRPWSTVRRGLRETVRRILRELVGLYWESGVSADVAALAWYLLSSLVPLALGLTALAAVALGDYSEAQALAARVSRALPEDVHDQVVALVLRTQRD
jgi:uncharacterized BrkB/YihY/UPF0761 family membrane protein